LGSDIPGSDPWQDAWRTDAAKTAAGATFGRALKLAVPVLVSHICMGSATGFNDTKLMSAKIGG
jgi:hypothetical protein